jgi:predicted RNA-binding protein associated with RNAse of E/G family
MMNGILDSEVLAEALAIIDRGLIELSQRELVSTAEASDLLLDVRSLLAGALEDFDVDELEVPVGS